MIAFIDEHRVTLGVEPICRLLQIAPSTYYTHVTQRREAGLEPSVGSVGDSYDNALAETVIGLYKTEVIHRRGPWRSLQAVELDTLEWVDWFNHRRLLQPIGFVPPAEAETAFHRALASQPIAA